MSNSTIAIVGMACEYPDAHSPHQLWENVLSQRRSFRRFPNERLRLDDYYSQGDDPDSIYIKNASVLKDYEFDRVRFRVAGKTYRSADLTHWLALDVATRALADAGFPEGEGLDREMTGVLLGNSLTGEFSRSTMMRLRWPYVRRVVDAKLAGKGWSAEDRANFLTDLEAQYKEPFPEFGEESLAGGLSNTIAGRVCNNFDFKGGGYTVDGACASSLLAVATACSSLVAGDIDYALAGGVDLSLDPFELVGFARTNALAPDKMRVFDQNSAGFWPGEGCGFVMLMRHEDAIAQNRRIYALIQGWGVSSDGSGGITRPEVDGQSLALKRAYRRAGYSPATVSYFEAHGTGTAVGDATELRTIATILENSERDEQFIPAVIGSLKANIGHTKAAAGVGGLIKATMALHNQLLPPTTGTEEPHDELTQENAALRVLQESATWAQDRPMRAGVNAMGFGGINSHVTLEAAPQRRKTRIDRRVKTLGVSWQDTELFLFSGFDSADLQSQLTHLLTFAEKISFAEMGDLAAELARTLTQQRQRAALVAATPAELTKRLHILKSWLTDGVTQRIDTEAGVFLSDSLHEPRLGYLFPGQGSASNLDGGALRQRFNDVTKLYKRAEIHVNGYNDFDTIVAQPAIVTASVAAMRVLRRVGIEAEVGVGHSLGEITALHWAGALDEETVFCIAKMRGKTMMELGDPTGTMASVAADHKTTCGFVNGEAVTIACFNTPTKTVISGSDRDVATVVARAQKQGISATSLAVSHAFHSPLVESAVAPLDKHLIGVDFRPMQRTLVSTVRGRALTDEDDLRAVLRDQVVQPVRFTKALAKAAEDVDLFIEVGPGRTLSHLSAENITTPVIPIDAGGKSLRGLLHAIGAAYALGAPVDQHALFAQRFTRPFDLNWNATFLTNPCELAPVLNGQAAPTVAKKRQPKAEKPELKMETVTLPNEGDAAEIADDETTLDLIRRLIADKIELPLRAVQAKDRLLSDLHLNSITVTQIVASAARKLQIGTPVAPTDFANVSIGEMAETLDELLENGSGAEAQTERLPAGIDTWVHAFNVEWEQTKPAREATLSGNSNWQVIAPDDHPLSDALQQRFSEIGGNGVVVCLSDSPAENELSLLLKGAQHALGGERFVLVQENGGGSAVARTLHLENPETTVCVVNLPFGSENVIEWVAAEAQAANGYAESRYDMGGQRWQPVMRKVELEDNEKLPFSAEDVLLVTGGGKGITAECALSLAQASGAKLALLGRSKPDDDEELAANLERMEAAGVEFGYFSADVTDKATIEKTIAKISNQLGTVTAILHGAARNVPQLLAGLDVETMRRTLAPKVTGLQNLLTSVDGDKLHTVISFGSIIAQTGLPSEADYGLANEWLAKVTRDYQQAHPDCRCLTINWSVWAGAGMGERLGILENLARQGITPIPLDDGIAMLHTLLAQDALPAEVVVASRSGALPTLPIEKPKLPFWRFIENVRVHYPQIEMVVDVELSAESDPYILDHIFQGERLFPTVMGLEAMAQVAMALVESAELPTFSDVQLPRPIVVPKGETSTIRIAALVRESGVVEVAVRTPETGYQVDHFRAVCRFDAAKKLPDEPIVFDQFPLLTLDVQDELYGDFLFQGGRFQQLGGYREMSAHHCLAQLTDAPSAKWFDRTLPSKLLLGNPGARDVTMHALQVCKPHVALLPIGVEGITTKSSANAPHYIEAYERVDESTDDTLIVDVSVADEHGNVVEQWHGLQLKMISGMDFTGAWSAPVVAPYLERQVRALMGKDVRVAMTRNDTAERPAITDATIQRALREQVTVQRRADGRPEVQGDWSVSAAHSADLTLAIAGAKADGAISCDIEMVEKRTEAEWQDLLNEDRFQLAMLVQKESGDDFDTAAARVWTAYECLRKGGESADQGLLFDNSNGDWLTLTAGKQRIVSTVMNIHGRENRIAIAILRTA